MSQRLGGHIPLGIIEDLDQGVDEGLHPWSEGSSTLFGLETAGNPSLGDTGVVLQLDVPHLLVVGDDLLKVLPHRGHVTTVHEVVKTELFGRSHERLLAFFAVVRDLLVGDLVLTVDVVAHRDAEEEEDELACWKQGEGERKF